MTARKPPDKAQIVEALRAVRDPDLKKDIVSLNNVRNVAVCEDHVRVAIELSASAAAMKDRFRGEVEKAVRGVDGVERVEIDFTTAPSRGGPMSQAAMPGVQNVIAIGAGKGGVGKSTLSALTAVGLARSGARVGLMDADVYGPSIPTMLGVGGAKPQLAGERILPVEACGLKVMSLGFLVEPGQAVIWRGPMIHGTVRQFLDQVEWGELDYLIVDLPPGTGDVPLTLSQTIPATGAVVVCTPQDVALADAIRAARMYQQLHVEVLGVVENMSFFIAPDTGKEYDLFGKGGAERAARELKVPFLGSIPINIAIRISGDKGSPERIFEEDPQGVGRAVSRVVDALVAQVEMRNAAQSGPLTLNVHP
jgi:ATP-binding protein involved in chromosome partitioning